jgi:hypothetical protein
MDNEQFFSLVKKMREKNNEFFFLSPSYLTLQNKFRPANSNVEAILESDSRVQWFSTNEVREPYKVPCKKLDNFKH